MNRRIDPGSAVTAFVLVTLFVVAVALSPKAKPAPPTPIEVLDSALEATFPLHVRSDPQSDDQVLSINVWRDSAQQVSDDSLTAIARFGNAHYRGAVEAIQIEFITPDGVGSRNAFLPQLLDGRATPVIIDRVRMHGPVDTTSTAAPFAASDLEAVVRALPLTTGYAARFPMYWRVGQGRELKP